MSEIKALEELREKLERDTSKAKLYPTAPIKHAFAEGVTIEGYRALADAIEAEIAERFMELPVDADGVPIKPGDIMQFRDDAPVRVDSIGNSKCYVGDFGWFGGNGGFYGKGTLKCCRHVNPRTLEDVLIEYRLKAYNLYADQELTGEERVNEFKKLDAEYDSDIRELLGVSE